ncbi:hypothetical protein EJB05_26405 [Eragrostis curvula]|uniref:Uncharacterized protein n=1 Tax=Eragrostis curvula TaxID=38414 RepID=A0A5J9UJP9_9POAL|nr:hypothetical protein EJB05_26405 [Eragrostis curvula]
MTLVPSQRCPARRMISYPWPASNPSSSPETPDTRNRLHLKIIASKESRSRNSWGYRRTAPSDIDIVMHPHDIVRLASVRG